jgi:hypothetical protein
MLKFSKEDSKKEKLIIVGLWVIVLYHIIGSFAVLIESIMLGSFSVPAGIFFILGIGLLLEKKWAVQVSTLISFIVFYMSIGIIFMYFSDGMSSDDDILMSIITLCVSGLSYFILSHEVTGELYDVNFIVLSKIQKVINWTVGLGFTAFVVTYLYTVFYEKGVYRGYLVAYGTIFFIGLGFLIGLVKAFRMKGK